MLLNKIKPIIIILIKKYGHLDIKNIMINIKILFKIYLNY